MLPDFLAGSYKRYKEDTALFTTWLTKAAASSGYKPRAIKHQDSEAGPSKPLATAKSSEVIETLATATNLSGRLKGKDRKAEKISADSTGKATDEHDETPQPTTVKYTITTEELLRQAEAVAACYVKSRMEVPTSLRSIVQRAIRARQRCSQWFQKSGVQNQHADNQHLHFIGVLEQSLKILEPCMEKESVIPAYQKQDKTSPEEATSTKNRFATLEAEEGPNVDLLEVSEVAVAVNVAEKAKISKGKPEVAVYELEEDDKSDEDLAFIIFCFFEDLHRTQAFIGELWGKYKARKCDLHTAAVTTNAAFDLVRQAEEDILARAPEFFNRKRSFDSIAIIIFYRDALEQGICAEARLNSKDFLRITPFDDFIYLSTARILMKFTYLADLPADLADDISRSYPLLCHPLRATYISRPDMLGTPEMDKREQEDLFLSRFIMDKHLWNMYKKNQEKIRPPPPLEDEFSQGLDRLMKEGVLSVALVFEARIFLDIQDIMGDEINRGYQDLLHVASNIDKIMNIKFVNGTWVITGERWHGKDMDIVKRIKLTTEGWVLEDGLTSFPKFKKRMSSQESGEDLRLTLGLSFGPQLRSSSHIPQAPKQELQSLKTRILRDANFSNVSMSMKRVPDGVDPDDPELGRSLRRKMVDSGYLPDDRPFNQEHLENARRMNIESIKPSSNLNFLRTTNLIYCGLVSFSMITDFESAGLALCNWHNSIWPTAHLYNALLRTSSNSKPWPEMEELIDLHKGTLFAGQLPSTAYEILVRCGLALGLPMSSFSRNPRNRINSDMMRSRLEANGIKLEATKISSIFRQYLERKTSQETCLVKLDEVLRKPGVKATRKEKDAWNRPLTTLQFLRMLEAKLPRISQRLQFDYITLTRQCTNLLKKIRQQSEIELQANYPQIPSEGNSTDRTLAWFVMRVLEENHAMALAVENSSRDAPAPMLGPQVAVAGQEMQKFLNTHRLQDLISNFNALPRPTHISSGICPNHWNISIRHVPNTPPGDLVYFVQPNSYYVHSEGPIQTAEGQAPGHVLDPKSLSTLQTIARLIMKAFTEGMGANMTSAPWSWSTNDPNFARRIIKVMKDMGVRGDLLDMQVAGADELRICDESWNNMRQRFSGLVNGSSI